MTRTIPRDTVAKIVADLAKGYRPVAEIARRHGEPVQVVEGIRAVYGPSQGALARAAEDLRRPVHLAAVVDPPRPPTPGPTVTSWSTAPARTATVTRTAVVASSTTVTTTATVYVPTTVTTTMTAPTTGETP